MDDYNIIIEDVLKHIRKEMQQIKYGKIIIELQENANKIDIVTEIRTRFDKINNPPLKPTRSGVEIFANSWRKKQKKK